MPYAILRTKKLKRGNLSGSSSHVTRTRETPNADPARLHLNRVLIGSGSPRESIKRRVNEIASARKQAGGRKMRSDSVLAVEYILTASPEHWADKSQRQAEQWAQHSIEFLLQRFGAENVVSGTLHMDEKSPHLHVYHVPAATDPKGRPTLSAKQYYGTPELLSQLQTDYAAHMQHYDASLKRGIKGSRATHKTVRNWYAEISRGVGLKVPALDELKIPTPPRLILSEARRGWAAKASVMLGNKIEKYLRTVLGRLRAATRAARHYQALYQAEQQRTAAYRALVEDPEQIRGWQVAARESLAVAQEAAARVREVEGELDQVEPQAQRSAAYERGLRALCEAIGIEPEDAEKKAPAVEKTLQRYRIRQRDWHR